MNPLLKKLAAYALARAKESSTWIGLITLIAGQYAHLALNQNQVAQIAGVAVALVGVVVALFPQSGVVGQIALAAAELQPGESLVAAMTAPALVAPAPVTVAAAPEGGAGKGPASYE